VYDIQKLLLPLSHINIKMTTKRYNSEIKSLVFGTEAPSSGRNYIIEKYGVATFPFRVTEIKEVENYRFEYEVWVVKVPSHIAKDTELAKKYAKENGENATLLWRKYNPDTIVYFFEGEELI